MKVQIFPICADNENTYYSFVREISALLFSYLLCGRIYISTIQTLILSLFVIGGLGALILRFSVMPVESGSESRSRGALCLN